LRVLVPTNTKLTHVFGSKVLVLVLVCYKLTLTSLSKYGQRYFKERFMDKSKKYHGGNLVGKVE
jgi:hypothetical protein